MFEQHCLKKGGSTINLQMMKFKYHMFNMLYQTISDISFLNSMYALDDVKNLVDINDISDLIFDL